MPRLRCAARAASNAALLPQPTDTSSKTDTASSCRSHRAYKTSSTCRASPLGQPERDAFVSQEASKDQ
eukprot:7765848-Lingulodinium_polyedra.AAC.1